MSKRGANFISTVQKWKGWFETGFGLCHHVGELEWDRMWIIMMGDVVGIYRF